LDEAASPQLLRALEFLGVWRAEALSSVFPLPQNLYHYTHSQGLLGILHEGQFWASHAAYLNDRSEISYSLETLKHLILDDHAVTSDVPNTAADDVMLCVANRFADYFDTYVVCFCRCGDLLSQWRGYGRGGGYAIGLDPSQLPLKTLPALELLPVTYDEERQVSQLRELVSRWRDVFVDPPTYEQDQITWERAKVVFAQALSLTAVAFKHPAFREEDEWRLVYRRFRLLPQPGLAVSYRPLNEVLVPYVRIDVRNEGDPDSLRLPLTEIVIGPTRDRDIARNALDGFLNSLGYPTGSVRVRSASAPLRGC